MNEYRAQRGAILAWRQSIQAPAPTGAVRPDRRWVLYARGYGTTWISSRQPFSGSGSQDYLITPSGGFALSGASAVLRNRVFTVSGGLTLAGSAQFSQERLFPVSGGVAFSGAPAFVRNQVFTISGGFVLAGSAPMVFIPAGGAAVTTSLALMGVGQ